MDRLVRVIPQIVPYAHGANTDSIINDLLKTGMHLVPTSSEWSQLWLPRGLAGQSNSLVSVPRQAVLSTQMGPVPCPK